MESERDIKSELKNRCTKNYIYTYVGKSDDDGFCRKFFGVF